MATGGDSTTAEALNCPICFKEFLVPRMLPCLHTICEHCLDHHIKQTKGTYVCPICEGQIVPRDTNIPKDELVSAFPLNDLMNALIESQNESDDDNNYCEPCQTKRKVSAKFWCVDCKERLCGPCKEYHTRQKQMKQHETVPICGMEHNIQSNLTFNQNCTRHPGHKLEKFCVNHRALCCGVCFVTVHRDCGDIRDINSAAEDQAKRCTYRDVIKQFSQIKTEIDKILADKMNNRSQIKTEKEQIIHTMDNRLDQIIENLKALRVSFKKETEDLYQETNNFIFESEKRIKCFQTNVTNIQLILESLAKKTSSLEKFIAFETLHSQVASHYDHLKLTPQDDIEIHFSLKDNAALRDIEELSSLVAVKTSSKQPESFKNRLKNVDDVMKKLFSMGKLSTASSAAQNAKPDPMTSQVTFVKAVTRQTYGRDTWFTGGTVLPDGRLLMVDYYNRRLVQLDKEYNLVKVYKVDGIPTDVAAGQTNNEIYIAAYRVIDKEYKIYKCTLDTSLTVVSKIKAPSGTWGIAVIGDNIIVSTCGAAVILNQDGTNAKSIPKSGDDCYVAVSQTKRTMYHTDSHSVVCRTLEGSEIFRYRHQQLEGPRGICTDTHGCTYICGRDSNNVHQVSPDGKRSRILALQTISLSWFGIFLPQRNEIIITSWNEDTVLEVYKLK